MTVVEVEPHPVFVPEGLDGADGRAVASEVNVAPPKGAFGIDGL